MPVHPGQAAAARPPLYEAPAVRELTVVIYSARRLLADSICMLLAARTGLRDASCVRPGPVNASELSDVGSAGILVVDLDDPGVGFDLLEGLATLPLWTRRVGLFDRFDAAHADLAFRLGLPVLISTEQPPDSFVEILLGEGAETLRHPEGLTRDQLQRLRSLTPRESEVLTLLASGGSNREIADGLSITSHTVAHHKRRLFSKLGIGTSSQAAAIAATAGFKRSIA